MVCCQDGGFLCVEAACKLIGSHTGQAEQEAHVVMVYVRLVLYPLKEAFNLHFPCF